MNWHENVSKDEVPPEYLWEDGRGLELWWASVEEKRDQRYGTGKSDDDDRDSTPQMAENDLARALKQGR